MINQGQEAEEAENYWQSNATNESHAEAKPAISLQGKQDIWHCGSHAPGALSDHTNILQDGSQKAC